MQQYKTNKKGKNIFDYIRKHLKTDNQDYFNFLANNFNEKKLKQHYSNRDKNGLLYESLRMFENKNYNQESILKMLK